MSNAVRITNHGALRMSQRGIGADDIDMIACGSGPRSRVDTWSACRTIRRSSGCRSKSSNSPEGSSACGSS